MQRHFHNLRFQSLGWDATLLDGGHWLGVALIIGRDHRPWWGA
jgi:hypothetical protein